MDSDLKGRIVKLARKKLLFTPHAVDQMNKPERAITITEVKEVLIIGEIIENYPKDKRGHSCLIMGYTSSNRPIHIVCSPKAEYLAIITVYVPDPIFWDVTFTKRMR